MVENFEKNARKHSEDPIQEALREHKSHWNHDASLLIAQLIAFKKGLNGRGEPRAGLPPSNIKNPLPSEVGRYLEQLSENYSKVISEAKNIIDEQSHYAETRVKSKKELSETIADSVNNLEKYASWWGSRAWQHVKTYGNPQFWFFQDEDLKDRMRLLRLSTDFLDNLYDLENALVSSGKDSIPTAVYKFTKFSEAFQKLLIPKMNIMVARHAKMLEEEKQDSVNKKQPKLIDNKILDEDNPNETTLDPEIVSNLSGEQNDYMEDNRIEKNIKEEENETENIDVDINKVIEINDDLLSATEVLSIMKALNIDDEKLPVFKIQFRKVKSLADNVKIKYRKAKQLKDNNELQSLQKLYIDLLKSYSEFAKDVAEFLGLDKNANWSFTTLSEQAKDRLKRKFSQCGMIFQKNAHSLLSRWLKRQKLKMFSNTTDQLRLETTYKVLNIIKNIDIFQDSLEKKDTSILDLSNEVKNIMLSCIDLGNDLYSLAKIYNVEYEEDRFNKKVNVRNITETHISNLKKIIQNFENIVKTL